LLVSDAAMQTDPHDKLFHEVHIYHVIHKDGCSLWSTGDSRRSNYVENACNGWRILWLSIFQVQSL